MVQRIQGIQGSRLEDGSALAKLLDEVREYREQIARGEVEPPRRDAKGDIIPSPSTRKPNVFDGLNLTEDNPAEIG